MPTRLLATPRESGRDAIGSVSSEEEPDSDQLEECSYEVNSGLGHVILTPPSLHVHKGWGKGGEKKSGDVRINELELELEVEHQPHIRSRECVCLSGTINTIETHKTQHEFTSEKEFLAWKEKKRTEKSQGTCKLGLYCTSSMEVVKADGRIRVTFYTDHHDHELGFPNLVHMVLPKSEKDRIAGMIMQGIEHHKILERVRETSGRNRTSILEKKDIENIIAAYGLSVNQSRHSDNSTSVRLNAQDMKDAGELLYFKDQGKLDPQNTEIPSEEFVLAFMKEGQQLMFSEQLKNTEKLQSGRHKHQPTPNSSSPSVRPSQTPTNSSSFTPQTLLSLSQTVTNTNQRPTVPPSPPRPSSASNHGFRLPVSPCNLSRREGARGTQSFFTLPLLRKHLQEAHDIVVKKVNHEFASEREFMEWKNRLEADVGVNYTLHRGSKKTTLGRAKTYYCRRSGKERLSSPEGSKCAPKSQGTCKLGFFCTSSIEVEIIRGTFKVVYFLDHYSHNLDLPNLVHMKLPKCEKDKVAAQDPFITSSSVYLNLLSVGMITQGISYNKILDRVRETSGGSRASILEKQDILNVARDYGLHQIQSRHPEDSISVRFIVQELKEANELLFFKDQGVIDSENPNIDKKELALGFMKQGQEFWFLNHLTNTETLQVCMDSTHCISQYAG
ncbi:hypothetical protein Pcinc_000452 [Petrolisthes cinctipes]|uniref:Uncharacterized protein n=2 Tax=Petrolisthes cinctipes TaxID=88211 RepID=A0AAE1L5C1_PETCI|nr:hypothetical protein Pcinc_000452 [Petrolisthes cinctipes]